MKTCIMLLFISTILYPSIIFSQEAENDSSAFVSQRWFYSQRSAPYDTIPQNSYNDALSQMNSMSPSGNYLSTSWSNIGPTSLNDVNGPYSGRVIALSFTTDARLFIGAAEGGVWEATSLSSINWVDHSSGLSSISSGAVLVSSGGDTIYYGTGESTLGFMYTYQGIGLYKSVNGGSSWSLYKLNPTGGEPIIFKIAVKPDDNTQLFASTSLGLYRSTNAGANWSVISGTFKYLSTDVAYSPTHTGRIYAVGSNPSAGTQGIGIIYSTDGGSSFSSYTGSDLTIVGRTQISLCSSNDNYISLVTDVGSDHMQVYESTNAGSNWHSGENINTSAQMGGDICIAVKPDDPATIFVGGGYLYKSTNYGANFSFAWRSDEPFHMDYHDIAFMPGYPNTIAAACDGGAFLTTDCGSNWISLNNSQLPIAEIYRFGSTTTKIYLGIEDEGSGYCNLSGGSWSLDFGYDGTGVAVSKFSDSRLQVMGNYGTIKELVNGSSFYSWSSDWLGYWDGRGYDWVGAVASHPTHPDEFYSARRKSSDHSTINFDKIASSDTALTTLGTFSSPIPPQNIEFSKTHPDTVYLGTSGRYGPEPNPTFGREIWKSTTGGATWGAGPKVIDGGSSMPELYITHITTAPPDEVYATLSGFCTSGSGGHVYKSTNGGTNWSDISGNLPNIPVNDIAVCYIGCSSRLLTVATDMGVFASSNDGSSWLKLASGMPTAVVMSLEYDQIENKLRAATFGRSVYEVSLGATYISTTISPQNQNIYPSGDVHICNGGDLKLKDGQTINMPSGKKIIVESGGTIEIASGSVNFQSSGSWNGIEIDGNAFWNVNSCSISNTTTPLTIVGSSDSSYSTLNIQNISTSGTGPLQINTRSNVDVYNCSFGYNFWSDSAVCGIACTGSDNINITYNTIAGGSLIGGGYFLVNAQAIAVDYGSNVYIAHNTITNIDKGIIVSNSSPLIEKNNITVNTSLEGTTGIGMDHSYSSTLNQNLISNYGCGVSLYISSPTMYYNNVSAVDTALFADYNSSPRLKPDYSGHSVYWDAGKNSLRANGNAMYLYDNSIPDVNEGFDTLHSSGYYINGNIYLGGTLSPPDYMALCNDWGGSVGSGNFNLDVTVQYSPYDCTPPGSSGEFSMSNSGPGEISPAFSRKILEPPSPPLVVYYGNGIYDTIGVGNSNYQMPLDKSLFLDAMNYELLGNYSTAYSTYQQVISEYKDSSTAINSLKRLLRCKDRMGVDTSSYSQLRSYYLSAISTNLSDTPFVKVASELSTKCLVRERRYTEAISEYESKITSSHDSLEILSAQLDVIETYMIMNGGNGTRKPFTGKYSALKPVNNLNGFSMIADKLYHRTRTSKHLAIPLTFSLSQNYPNPFNPVTKIKYSLPSSVKVTIKVYDILGRLVKTIVNNELKEAGFYSVTFDGTNLASGVYFYRIEAGKFVESKKMVIVK